MKGAAYLHELNPAEVPALKTEPGGLAAQPPAAQTARRSQRQIERAAANAQTQLPGSCTTDLSGIGADVAAPEARGRKRPRSASPDAAASRRSRRSKAASPAAPVKAAAPPLAPQPAPAASTPAPQALKKAAKAPASKRGASKKSDRAGKRAPQLAKAATPAPTPAAPAQQAPVQLTAAADAEAAPATELQAPKLALRVKIGTRSFLAMEHGLDSPTYLPGLAEPQPAAVSFLPGGEPSCPHLICALNLVTSCKGQNVCFCSNCFNGLFAGFWPASV